MAESGLIDGRFPVELFAGGVLAWHEVWELRLVCKSFHAAADRDCLYGVWDTVVVILSSMNGFNKCSRCEVDSKECTCTAEEQKVAQERQWLADPRVGREEDRADLEGADAQLIWEERTPYNKAVALIRFQKTCVSNLLAFHADPNPIGYTFVDDDWNDDETFPAKIFEEKNQVGWDLVADLAQLYLADEDLAACDQYWYKSAFKGVNLDPYSGSSFSDAFCSVVQSMLGENAFERRSVSRVCTPAQIEYSAVKDFVTVGRRCSRTKAEMMRIYAVLGPHAVACDVPGQRTLDVLAADEWNEWEAEEDGDEGMAL